VIEWGEVRKTTPLNFIYPAEREADPLIEALLEIMRGLWPLETG